MARTKTTIRRVVNEDSKTDVTVRIHPEIASSILSGSSNSSTDNAILGKRQSMEDTTPATHDAKKKPESNWSQPRKELQPGEDSFEQQFAAMRQCMMDVLQVAVDMLPTAGLRADGTADVMRYVSDAEKDGDMDRDPNEPPYAPYIESAHPKMNLADMCFSNAPGRNAPLDSCKLVSGLHHQMMAEPEDTAYWMTPFTRLVEACAVLDWLLDVLQDVPATPQQLISQSMALIQKVTNLPDLMCQNKQATEHDQRCSCRSQVRGTLLHNPGAMVNLINKIYKESAERNSEPGVDNMEEDTEEAVQNVIGLLECSDWKRPAAFANVNAYMVDWDERKRFFAYMYNAVAQAYEDFYVWLVDLFGRFCYVTFMERVDV